MEPYFVEEFNEKNKGILQLFKENEEDSRSYMGLHKKPLGENILLDKSRLYFVYNLGFQYVKETKFIIVSDEKFYGINTFKNLNNSFSLTIENKEMLKNIHKYVNLYLTSLNLVWTEELNYFLAIIFIIFLQNKQGRIRGVFSFPEIYDEILIQEGEYVYCKFKAYVDWGGGYWCSGGCKKCEYSCVLSSKEDKLEFQYVRLSEESMRGLAMS
jgi:hypothetical protein